MVDTRDLKSLDQEWLCGFESRSRHIFIFPLTMMKNNIEWSENVILADADYVDAVAFNLTVNFERMLGRRVPQADMAQWAECVAMDGGKNSPETTKAPSDPSKGREEESVQVVLVHEREHTSLKNFTPGNYAEELEGKAVQSRVGEIVFNTVQTEEMAPKELLLKELLQLLCQQKAVKRLMVVVDDMMVNALRPILQRNDSDERRTTLLTMQPVQGGAYRHVLLGYSLMAALGISSREIEEKLKN